ncbi:hypothetical protein QQP08_027339 [Theobroma cacao]|nr:hypothetical protein QQP08_027339 [Theobroma cacao]
MSSSNSGTLEIPPWYNLLTKTRIATKEFSDQSRGFDRGGLTLLTESGPLRDLSEPICCA